MLEINFSLKAKPSIAHNKFTLRMNFQVVKILLKKKFYLRETIKQYLTNKTSGHQDPNKLKACRTKILCHSHIILLRVKLLPRQRNRSKNLMMQRCLMNSKIKYLRSNKRVRRNNNLNLNCSSSLISWKAIPIQMLK